MQVAAAAAKSTVDRWSPTHTARPAHSIPSLISIQLRFAVDGGVSLSSALHAQLAA